MLDPVAHRAGSPPVAVQVRQCPPGLSDAPSTNACLVEFRGLDSTPRRIHGEGSMQALCLAAQPAVQSLATFAARECRLTSPDGGAFDPSVFGQRLLASGAW